MKSVKHRVGRVRGGIIAALEYNFETSAMKKPWEMEDYLDNIFFISTIEPIQIEVMRDIN